jgi:hydroxypyruvate isomerase
MFDLAVCAEMVFLDLPVAERVRRIADLGFQVEIWDWTGKDVDALGRTGAVFSSMTGHVTGTLTDEELVRRARPLIGEIQVADVPDRQGDATAG